MKALIKRNWVVIVIAVVLWLLTIVTIYPYGGNLTTLFHLDETTRDTYGVPSDFIVLTVPGYDGEQYYAIAKQMPAVFTPSKWPVLREHSSQAYAYQRFLLPLLAFLLSFGSIAFLPNAFYLIQILSIFGAAGLLYKAFPKKPLYAFAVALSPAALIGLHFSLAEPLTIFLLTAFLVRFIKDQTLTPLDIILLSLFVLTREINIFFIDLLFLWFIFKKQWRNAALMLIPAAVFLGLHGLIFAIFHEIPFLWSTDKRALPLVAIAELLSGARGYTTYTLSAIALFLGFVLPALIWTGATIGKKILRSFVPLAAFVFLCLMLLMPDHIWGSITSIGRVITPVYPLFLVHAATRDTLPARLIAIAILILGLMIGISLALIPHPFILS